MFYVLVFILLSLFTIIAWRNFTFALFILAGILPIYLLRLQIGFIPTTVLELVIIITFFVWLTQYKTWSKKLFVYKPWMPPMFLLFLSATIGIFISTNIIDALGIWKAYFIEPMLVFFMFITTIKKEKDWIQIFYAFAITSIILSILAILQYFTGFGIPIPWDIERRVTSVFMYPNALGLFVSPIIAMSVVLFFYTKKWFWVVSATLGFVTIILSQTEAALIAIPASLLITLIISQTKKKIKLIVTFGCIAIFSIMFVALPVVREKIFLQDYSGQVRTTQWNETLSMLSQNPIFGAGLNNYPNALKPFHDSTFYEIFQYPHNIILNIWSELGILGLVAFFWLAWLVVKTQKNGSADPLVYAVCAALFVMASHGLVDVPYFKNDLAVMTWIFLAFILQTRNRVDNESTRSRNDQTVFDSRESSVRVRDDCPHSALSRESHEHPLRPRAM